MSTHFSVFDKVIVNCGDPIIDGTRGVVSVAERFNPYIPVVHERWAKVELKWPGTHEVRSYSFKESELLPDHAAAEAVQSQPDAYSV